MVLTNFSRPNDLKVINQKMQILFRSRPFWPTKNLNAMFKFIRQFASWYIYYLKKKSALIWRHAQRLITYAENNTCMYER